ncbi:hypothetical protein SAMN04487928_11036 [Butyrivibrio proteoclasticus]|uniref:Zinc ribbon domain-containing protein n=1 Tax=Butyrivibrio proteoclasticus TaxID=43305 RepID=A0A1I5TW20_9FIRM|nr:zinc ribbon domain-containing protein [Butyrivibrio proteoclasticus]SFP86807.1 hypothetical protein SAMN04487928_11036 [Butyrivibrio proteoclasticus]
MQLKTNMIIIFLREIVGVNIKKIDKCANCGAEIQIHEGQERAFCQYCGAEYFIEKDKPGLTEAAFSYLNKVGERRQDELRRKEEAKEREKIRQRHDSNRAILILAGIAVFCFIFSFLFGDKSTESIDKEINENAATSVTENNINETNKKSKDGFVTSTNQKQHVGIYDFYVPLYYKTNIAESDRYSAYAETDGKVVMLQCNSIADNETVDLDWFKDEENAKEYAESFLTSVSGGEFIEGSIKKFGGTEGYLLKYKMSPNDIPGIGWVFIFPSIKDNNWVSVVLGQTDNSEYDYYSDYEKIISSFQINDEVGVEASEKETTQEPAEDMDVSFDKEMALRAFVVAVTNAFSADIFTADGSTVDISKLHSYSDTNCEFYFNIVSKGEWIPSDENTWHGYDIKLRPCSGASQAVINDGVCNVTFDGTNYIVKDLRGVLAIFGQEEYGTKLSTIEDWSDADTYLVIPQKLIEKDR